MIPSLWLSSTLGPTCPQHSSSMAWSWWMIFPHLTLWRTVLYSGLTAGRLSDTRWGIFFYFFYRFITILLQYKLFEAEGSECETLNNFCTCHLEGEDRTMAVFTVSVPTLGNYYLRLVQHLEAALLLKSCNFCWYGLMDCSPSCNKYLTRMLAIFGSIYWGHVWLNCSANVCLKALSVNYNWSISSSLHYKIIKAGSRIGHHQPCLVNIKLFHCYPGVGVGDKNPI